METAVLGILAVLIGALLCFRGYLAFRAVIAVWGAFAGFVLGAGVVADLPLTILAILSAFAGASSIVTGLLLLVGILDRTDLAAPQVPSATELGWWWSALYLGVAVVGLLVQLRDADARRAGLRDAWAG